LRAGSRSRSRSRSKQEKHRQQKETSLRKDKKLEYKGEEEETTQRSNDAGEKLSAGSKRGTRSEGGRLQRRQRQRTGSSGVPDWLKRAMIEKKKEQEENSRLAEEKELKEKVERQREMAGVAERAKRDEDMKIPGITFDDSPEINVKFDYKAWEENLDEVYREIMVKIREEMGLESMELRTLGKKDTVAILKKVCKDKSLRTSLRKIILELYSKVNRKRAAMLAQNQADARMVAEEELRRKIQRGEIIVDANSRTAQRKRQCEILEAFARNRGGAGKMVKHKFNAKRLPKLFS